jgi:hypothetical protein
MGQFCQIEYVSSDSDNGIPCGKPAVVRCADCGASICADCQLECCGDSYCELCYDYHLTPFVISGNHPQYRNPRNTLLPCHPVADSRNRAIQRCASRNLRDRPFVWRPNKLPGTALKTQWQQRNGKKNSDLVAPNPPKRITAYKIAAGPGPYCTFSLVSQSATKPWSLPSASK